MPVRLIFGGHRFPHDQKASDSFRKEEVHDGGGGDGDGAVQHFGL